MSEEAPHVICIGEALIELTRGVDGSFAAACAGDSFNTAVYLARAGLRVGFATAVGDDPYSDSIVALALAEGLEANLILRVPGRLPALSLVEPGRTGKRLSRVWGEGTPAREIPRLAKRAHADLLVLGTHGRTGFSRLFMGSVASRVVASATCPVMTVRG